MNKYKTTGKQTLFDAENSARKLSEIGNPLEKLDSVIDFEMFRSRLEASMVNYGTKSKAGAKQYDVVMMFKVMVLRQYYNLSYEQTEYQIIDRSSFKQFLGLASGDKVPDANTIRNFFEGWNSAKDESSAILGAQFKIGKYVKIAPNFRMILSKTNETENVYTAYLNCQVGF